MNFYVMLPSASSSFRPRYPVRPVAAAQRAMSSKSVSGMPVPSPSVWLLIDDRPGHRTLGLGVLGWLGWPSETKPLAFTLLNRLPNALVGSSLATLTTESRRLLHPPYPDLVIAVGRRCVPPALWIKQASGGRARVVLLGRKAVIAAASADLSIRCSHFQGLAHPGLVEITLPPSQVNEAALAEALARHGDPLQGLARPRTVFLLGGPTAQHDLRPAFAADAAGRLAAAVAALGGSLAIVTSRRTPLPAIEAIRAAVPQARLHVWKADEPDNPFLAYLAAADLLAVTGESESMLAEAIATGKPVSIIPLPERPPSAKDAWIGALWRRAAASGHRGRLARALFGQGWLTPPRDLNLLHARLEAEGRAGVFRGVLNQTPPAPGGERSEVIARIRALFPQRPPAP